MFVVAFGLSSAVAYALHDLLTQRLSRVHGLVRVLCWIVPVGAVVLVPTALAVDGLPATGDEWRGAAYSAAAGALYLATWFTIVRALQIGNLSLVAPLASLEGLFVALYAVARGEKVTALLGIGIALAVIGGLLASVQGRARSAAGATWALATSVLWAGAVVCFDHAHHLSWLSQAAWSRMATLILFISVAVGVLWWGRRAGPGGGERTRAAFGRRVRALCLVAAVLELGGLAGMTLAVERGPLTVAGVTVAQYATVAVILGLVFLRERPRRHQVVGVVLTVVAVTILGAVGSS